jgi:hypothetical protein
MRGGRVGAVFAGAVAAGGGAPAFCAKALEGRKSGARSAAKSTCERQRRCMVGRGLYHFLARA